MKSENEKNKIEKTELQSANLNGTLRLPEKVALVLILASFFIFALLFFVLPVERFSENENRYLAKPPVFTLDNLVDGRLTEQIKDYLSDHFPWRDGFLSLCSEAARLSGRREIAGVYIANDDSLIDAYKEPQNTGRITEAFTRVLTEVRKADAYVMLVPTAVEINKEQLPKGCYDQRVQGRQQAVIDEIYTALDEAYLEREGGTESAPAFHTVDAALALYEDKAKNNDKESLYYRTDHHWTMRGAYSGYLAFCKEASLNALALTAYQAETVSEDFYGTTWSKLCDSYFQPDTITIYTDPAWNISVLYEDSGEIDSSPYNLEYVQKKDKYSLFLNNLHPLVTITNHALTQEKDAKGNGGAIAVIKDSYANSLIPFLINHYHTIYVFDTRYYTEGVIDFINSHEDIDTVLILYNPGTMDTDTGIGGIY